MQNGLRVLLHVPNDDTADKLDKLLWHYPATAFLPHCHSHEADAATMPVVIGRDENFPSRSSAATTTMPSWAAHASSSTKTVATMSAIPT